MQSKLCDVGECSKVKMQDFDIQYPDEKKQADIQAASRENNKEVLGRSRSKQKRVQTKSWQKKSQRARWKNVSKPKNQSIAEHCRKNAGIRKDG